MRQNAVGLRRISWARGALAIGRASGPHSRAPDARCVESDHVAHPRTSGDRAGRVRSAAFPCIAQRPKARGSRTRGVPVAIPAGRGFGGNRVRTHQARKGEVKRPEDCREGRGLERALCELPESPETAYRHPVQLQQVLMNLMLNGIEAMKDLSANWPSGRGCRMVASRSRSATRGMACRRSRSSNGSGPDRSTPSGSPR